MDLGSGGVRGVGPPVPLITHHSIMYAPKCLVLISTLDYFETFRVSLQFEEEHPIGLAFRVFRDVYVLD